MGAVITREINPSVRELSWEISLEASVRSWCWTIMQPLAAVVIFFPLPVLN